MVNEMLIHLRSTYHLQLEAIGNGFVDVRLLVASRQQCQVSMEWNPKKISRKSEAELLLDSWLWLQDSMPLVVREHSLKSYCLFYADIYF